MGPEIHGRGEDQGLYFRNVGKTTYSKMVETHPNTRSVNVNTESRLKLIISDDTWLLVLTTLCSGLARWGVCGTL